ncbi:MAG: hypothetical protein ACW976_06630, partial [Candidatus Ranarchaeia archaeon]
MIMHKRKYLVLTVVLCFFVVNAFTLPTVQAELTEHDHITYGEVLGVFHAYQTGGAHIEFYADDNAVENAAPVLNLDGEIYRAFILPWGPWVGNEYFCVEDAHFTMYAISFFVETRQEAAAEFARIYDEFLLVHP